MSERIYWSQHAPIKRRHAELVGGGTNRPLDEEGIARAEHMARSMATAARLGVLLNLSGEVISSPLDRAQKTSEIIAKHLGFTVVTDENLRAQHFGALEGKTAEEALSDPALAPHLHSNLPPDELFMDTAPDGGESVEGAYSRLVGVRARLLSEDSGNPIVITHGSMLKTLVGSVNNRPIVEWGGITREFKGRIIDDDGQRLISLDYLEAA